MLEQALVTLGLVILLLWGFGIAGFFRAGRARRVADAATAEVAALRAELTALRAALGQPALASGFGEPAGQAANDDPATSPTGVEPPTDAAPAIDGRNDAAEGEGRVIEGDGLATDQAAFTAEAETPAAPKPPKPSLEEALTQRWGVWLGAGALLLAVIFLISTAIEEGWLGPAARTTLAALLGAALIIGAEYLGRRPLGGTAPDRAPAALAAGGVAFLFGAAYAAGPLYELLPPLIAFILMALAAIAGLFLALRRGPMVAAVGLVGAFLTPALVASDAPSMIGLFAYLLAVTAAAMAVVRMTAWGWLGWCACLLAALYVLVAPFGEGLEIWAAPLFVPLATALHLALLPRAALETPLGRRLAHLPLIALGLALIPSLGASTEAAPMVGLLLLSPIAVARARGLTPLPWLAFLAAALGLFGLLVWSVEAWMPTAEAVIAGGAVQAIIPGDFAPEALRTYLVAALALALIHAAAGLAFERRHGLRFATLAAAVPLLTLFIAYVRVAGFAVDIAWAAAALGLAAFSTAAATRAAREAAPQRAGIHAAGAAAALSLMAAMLLRDQWLSLAIALLLPPLALIAGRTGLPALRPIAAALAALVLIRLLLNEFALGYAFGGRPVLNGLWLAYGLPALAFWLAAQRFRRDGPAGGTCLFLETGALTLFTALILLLIRHAVNGGRLDGADWPFVEQAMQLAAIALLAQFSLWAARPGPFWQARPHPFTAAWQWLGAGAGLGTGWLLVVENPWWTGQAVGDWPLLNALLPAYAVPALIFGAFAARAPECAVYPALRRLVAAVALAGAFAFVTLSVRHAFSGANLAKGRIGEAELYAYSGAWLVFAAALIWAGLRSGGRSLRLAGLLLIALATLKVFLIDMNNLEGLWRALSFLGLGLALIALGAVYRRFLGRRAAPDAGAGAASWAQK